MKNHVTLSILFALSLIFPGLVSADNRSADFLPAEERLLVVTVAAGLAVLVFFLVTAFVLRHKLQRNSERYRSLFLNAPIAMMEMKKSGKVLQVNKAFTDRLGYTIDDIGEIDRWLELAFADDAIRERERENIRRGISEDYSFDRAVEHGEFSLRCSDGTEKVFVIGANEAYDEYILSFTDIDDRKKMAAEIGKTRDLFYTLFELAPFSCVINSIEGNILDANQHFCNRVGKSKAELIGLTNADLGREIDPVFKGVIMKQLAAEGQCRIEEVEIPLASGPEWVLFASRIIEWADETAILSVSIDITEKKRAEIELKKHRDNLEQLVDERTRELEAAVEARREKEARLVQAERMASLGVLTAGVSHEINNPLNFLMGAYINFKEYFDVKESGNSDINLLLEGMKAGIDRTASIVRMLNQFGREDAGGGERCDIGEILDNCLLVLQGETGERISIERSYPLEAVTVNGSSGKLHQAFLSVLRNAGQAIDGTGLVKVELGRLGEDAEIIVSDSGCGIPADDIPRIIEPFYTGDSGSGGPGLGLSLCYSIIQEHNGSMEFESVPGKGTSVRIVINGGDDGE